MTMPLIALGITAMLVVTAESSFAADRSKETGFFETRIRPLLVEHCYDCHGPDEAAARLRLDTKGGWERGGERGPAIVPSDPSVSLLIRAVSYRDEKLKMPPEETGDRLTDVQVQDLTTWIRQGAHDPREGRTGCWCPEFMTHSPGS